MDGLIPMIIVLPLLVFWLWMFWDMTNNDSLPRWMYWDMTNNDSLPSRRYNWTLAFVFLNVFAAAIYFATARRSRH